MTRLQPRAVSRRASRRPSSPRRVRPAAVAAFDPIRSATEVLLRRPAGAVPETRRRLRRRSRSDIDLFYDLSYDLFVTARRDRAATCARRTSTRSTRCPDSSWFTNRVGTRPLTVEEIVRGPVTGPAPQPGNWTIIPREERRRGARLHGHATPAARPGSSPSTPRPIPTGPPAQWWCRRSSSGPSATTRSRTSCPTCAGSPSSSLRTATQAPAQRQAHAADAERHRRGARARRRRAKTARYRIAAGRMLPGKVLGGFQYRGPGPTTPTISCRTSTGASCGRCASSARGPTSSTRRPATPSTR